MGIKDYFARKRGDDVEEHEKIVALEQAEREVSDLKRRAQAAVATLEARQRRNHWREAVQELFLGGTP